ncbi:MAG: nucleoside 2-deoxyribosyltransferase [Methanofollis sp.]|nr:nucleoside 2-deoxyribosyltransferase [Methanofollis sp.]
MYVLCAPCVLDPYLRADGITKPADLEAFRKVLDRCRHFGIEVVPLPCPETAYLGRPRPPGTFVEHLDTPGFRAVLDQMEEEVRKDIAARGLPLFIVGVDSSPCCGVNQTWYDTRVPGRGAFLSRFPEIEAIDVYDFARYRIYFAAPLFNEAERAFNRQVRDLLEEHWYEVYLPQEVGDDGASRDMGDRRQIFETHVEALREVDAVVAVIDGADADSGTSWEMGYAAGLGIPVVALRTDFRRAGPCEHVNLMLEESAEVVTDTADLIAAVRRVLVSGVRDEGEKPHPL